ncbi:hypothetical protein OG754_10810 [Streptomyces decoyicus]|uniref:DUF6545 domain-containing protein n=1 Tax=Streptomyces decoyicus TaxID=249567 RepID=UPI002E3452CB|nr:DUF6545 domain-containing protein [Streptomyces decoyicus]
MLDAPDLVEKARGVLLLVVWSVLILRIPALRHPRRRPVWYVLVALALGSLVIQAPVGRWIDATTGIAKAGDLAVALVALTDFAAVWWFAIRLHTAGYSAPAWLRRAPWVSGATMAALALFFFAVTPAAERFGEQARGGWTGYMIAWIAYGLLTAVGAGALFWKHGLTMRSPVLRVSVLALALGTSAEVPYLVVRTIRWITPDSAPELALTGFWCSFARFVLVALGCSLAALEPPMKALLHWHRRQRLRALWLLLRQATPELMVVPPPSRGADLLDLTHAWERLHQRVIDIRDSITYLHDGWASPRLLEEARRCAAGAGAPESRRLTATACWIEATRREAVAGVPKRHLGADKGLLPQVLADDSTMCREIGPLLRLHRALRSRHVRDFADDVRPHTSLTAGR